jgi:hypothetical protein
MITAAPSSPERHQEVHHPEGFVPEVGGFSNAPSHDKNFPKAGHKDKKGSAMRALAQNWGKAG